MKIIRENFPLLFGIFIVILIVSVAFLLATVVRDDYHVVCYSAGTRIYDGVLSMGGVVGRGKDKEGNYILLEGDCVYTKIK